MVKVFHVKDWAVSFDSETIPTPDSLLKVAEIDGDLNDAFRLTTEAANGLKQDGYRHRDSFRANRILCYPGGFSITILREQGFCILNTPEYKDTKISRSTAAQLLTGIRKGIRDLNQSREAAL